MTEREIITKIKELSNIKADSEWAFLTKKKILEKKGFSFASLINEIKREKRFIFGHKMAFSALVVFIALIGIFGFTLNSVPGDSLFALKKVTENSSLIFVSKVDQPKYNFALANKRLDDLTKIAEDNDINSLAVAINEYQESIAKTAKSLINVDDSYIIEELANEIKELEEKEERMKSLGIEVGQKEELNSILADIVLREIEGMESRERTEKEEEILNNVKFEYEQGNYSKALEVLLLK